jgi:hypothetical protein
MGLLEQLQRRRALLMAATRRHTCRPAARVEQTDDGVLDGIGRPSRRQGLARAHLLQSGRIGLILRRPPAAWDGNTTSTRRSAVPATSDRRISAPSVLRRSARRTPSMNRPRAFSDLHRTQVRWTDIYADASLIIL